MVQVQITPELIKAVAEHYRSSLQSFRKSLDRTLAQPQLRRLEQTVGIGGPVVSIFGNVHSVAELHELCRIIDLVQGAHASVTVEHAIECIVEDRPLNISSLDHWLYAKPIKVLKKRVRALGFGAQVTGNDQHSIRRGLPALRASPAVQVFIKIQYPGLL